MVTGESLRYLRRDWLGLWQISTWRLMVLWTRRRGEDGEKWSDFACFLKVVSKGLREPLDK